MTEAELRASEYRQLLDNPRLEELFATLETRYCEQLFGVDVGKIETKERDALILRVQIIKELRSTARQEATRRSTAVRDVV